MTLAEKWLRDSRKRFVGLRAIPKDGTLEVIFSDGTVVVSEGEFQKMAVDVEKLK